MGFKGWYFLLDIFNLCYVGSLATLLKRIAGPIGKAAEVLPSVG